jgi:hypothetical protein
MVSCPRNLESHSCVLVILSPKCYKNKLFNRTIPAGGLTNCVLGRPNRAEWSCSGQLLTAAPSCTLRPASPAAPSALAALSCADTPDPKQRQQIYLTEISVPTCQNDLHNHWPGNFPVSSHEVSSTVTPPRRGFLDYIVLQSGGWVVTAHTLMRRHVLLKHWQLHAQLHSPVTQEATEITCYTASSCHCSEADNISDVKILFLALYPHKLALTSPTSGGRSVGIVCSQTQTMEFSLVFSPILLYFEK